MVTILSYVVLLGGTYIGVDLLGFPATPTYVVALTLVYMGVYIFSSRYVFRVAGSRKHMKRFAIAVVFLWALNSSVFYALETVLAIQYLLAAVINIFIFGPLRFVVNRKFVFVEHE